MIELVPAACYKEDISHLMLEGLICVLRILDSEMIVSILWMSRGMLFSELNAVKWTTRFKGQPCLFIQGGGRLL